VDRIFVILLFIFVINENGYACNVCHSKKPEMVKMHRALEFKDCFSCHGIGKKQSKEDLKKQQKTDNKCIRCHLSN
jgi:hypothetical protein